MSKAHEELSPQPAASQDESATPPPVQNEGQSPTPAVAVAGTRRAQVSGPVARERSGPIGIAGGDFATPTVRRRTITQPRGTPILGVPLSLPSASVSDGVTPPPVVAQPAASAPTPPAPTPAAETSAAELTPPPVAQTPVAVTPPPVAQAAVAQAPVALTPPPVLQTPPALTPPPVQASATPPPVPLAAKIQTGEVRLGGPAMPDQRARPVAAQPSELGAAAGEGPESALLESPFAVPTAAAIEEEVSPLSMEAAAVRALDSGPLTPPPELPIPQPISVPMTPPVEEAPPPSPPPPVSVSPPSFSPAPEPAGLVDLAGALPESPMGSDGSVASSEANEIFSAAPAPTDSESPAAISTDADLELNVPEELEVDESGDGDGAAVAPPPRPATGPTTPPPIPGSFFKTPGPELKRPSPASPSDEGPGPLLPGVPNLPEALSQRPRRPRRSKPWFEEVFDEDYLRTLPFMDADQTLREVEFIADVLGAPQGAEILDIGCGYGRHAIEMVQRGYGVTGLDLSLPLLIRAADEAQRRALQVNFVHADMREMAFDGQFDAAYSMLTSFGYFDEETNLRVAEGIGRALKPGKRFLLDIVNRDYVVADLPVRVWWEGTGCVVLEEVDFNFHTSRINTHRSIVFEDGRQVEQELSVRAYSLHEIGRLLRQAGFRVVDVSGGLATRSNFFGSASRSLLIVAEKRDDDG